MVNFKLGDRVQVKLYNGTYEGTVIKINKTSLTIDRYDSSGRSLTALFSACSKLPSVNDIGYATSIWIH